jgi:hypothetical protein
MCSPTTYGPVQPDNIWAYAARQHMGPEEETVLLRELFFSGALLCDEDEPARVARRRGSATSRGAAADRHFNSQGAHGHSVMPPTG